MPVGNDNVFKYWLGGLNIPGQGLLGYSRPFPGRFSFIVVFPDPYVIARQREGASQDRCQESDDFREYAAPAADMYRVYPAPQFARPLLVFVRGMGQYIAACLVERIAVGRPLVAPTLIRNRYRSFRYGYAVKPRIPGVDLVIHMLPMPVRGCFLLPLSAPGVSSGVFAYLIPVLPPSAVIGLLLSLPAVVRRGLLGLLAGGLYPEDFIKPCTVPGE